MQSWVPAVLFLGFCLAFARVKKSRSLAGLAKTSTATGTLTLLLGWFKVIFAFPSSACPDFRNRRPTLNFDHYESSYFPLRATCHWDNGEQKALVGAWMNPLLFTCMAVLTGCLVTMAVLAHRRYRKGHPR
ncbi:hypothetical protein ACLQ18_44775 [Streptomyces sp. DT193]|uniref:hypothetical protein n=1 Tax=Streptomyces sp. DT193 TaxID=3393418 RepID=UPI003CF3505C